MIITFIRHAETESNANMTLMGGRVDSPLTDKGVDQAIKSKTFFSNLQKDIVYCSSNERAKSTLSLISGLSLHSIEYLDLLREQDYGVMTGVPIVEIPAHLNSKFLQDPFEYAHPEGESFADLLQRVGLFFEKYIEIPELVGKNIIVLTHENVIRACVAYMKNLDREVLSLKFKNCGFTQYEFREREYKCRFINKVTST